MVVIYYWIMRLLKFVWLLSFLFVFNSCHEGNYYQDNIDSFYNERILLKSSILYEGYRYHIIEVDGVEYISSGDGGLYPLVVSPCND